MSAKSYEAGIRPFRLEYVQESSVGVAPTDPSWSLYSDNARVFDPTIDPQTEEQRGLGTIDSQGAFTGTESHQLNVQYDLQQKSSSGDTLEDGSGNANDAATDGLKRDSDNRINNTHTVVRRMVQSDLEASNTVNGSTSKDTRQYVVAKGGYPDNPTLTGDPNDPQPILVDLGYEFEKIRTYQIDQPGSSQQIDVISSNVSDSGSVKIENEDAGTSESVTITASGTATTTASFSDIDAVEIDSEQAGDIDIAGSSSGDTLMTIRGQESYDHGEGDLGVPALGSGSHASSIGQSYELYHDDQVEQPNNTTIADGVETVEFDVTNDVSGDNATGGARRALAAGDRTVTVSGTVFGETEYVDHVVDMLTTDTGNVRWTLGGGYIQADSATEFEVSGSEEASQGKKMVDISFQGQGLTTSN